MSKRVIGLVVVIVSLIMVAPLSAKGPGGGKDVKSPATLTDAEIHHITYVRQEEKLARDVYLTLYEVHHNPIFLNISESEQRHMDAMKRLIDKYDLEDPIIDDTVGVFPVPEQDTETDFNVLYSELVSQGETDCGALQAGLDIENLDITDIEIALYGEDGESGDVEAQDITKVLNNLLSGSYNHLSAFTSQYQVNSCNQ